MRLNYHLPSLAQTMVTILTALLALTTPVRAQDGPKLPDGVIHLTLPPGAVRMDKVVRNGKPILRVTVDKTIIEASAVFLGDGKGAIEFEATKDGINWLSPYGTIKKVGDTYINQPGTALVQQDYTSAEDLEAGSLYVTTPSLKFEFGMAVQKKDRNRFHLAKEVSERFMNGIWTRDIKAVMGTVDLPFFLDGAENVNNLDRLKDEFERMLRRDRSKIEYKVKTISNFGSIPNGFFNNKDHEALKKLIEKTDPIVLFELTKDGIAIVVRIREGKAKVVGFRD